MILVFLLLPIMSGAAQCNWFLFVLSLCKCKLAIFCETNTDDWCGLRYLFYCVSGGENYSRGLAIQIKIQASTRHRIIGAVLLK